MRYDGPVRCLECVRLFFFQAEDGIRDYKVTGVQTCALPILPWLERIQEAKHYSNFGPLVRELEADFSIRFGLPVEQVTTVANATQGLELVLQEIGRASCRERV